MKVLIATPYFSPKVGGMENYALNLALELKRLGWDVVIVCGDDVASVTHSVDHGLSVYRLPIWKTLSNTPVNLAWVRMIRSIIRAEQPDIINTHTPVPFMVDMVLLAARKIPVVVTYHAATLQKPGSALMSLIIQSYGIWEKLMLRRATHLVAVSPYVKTALSRRFSLPMSVVSNAVRIPAVVKPENRSGLVFVANLEPTHAWKGLDLILDAMAINLTAGKLVEPLTVIGDGSFRDHYEARAAALNVKPYVSFLGRLTGKERDAAMNQALALIAYPTTANDAFPTVFLEAWALGLPVIAAAIGPIPSLIQDGENGLLVTPNNAGDLAQAIQLAFRSRNRLASMGSNGRTLIESTYNWPAQAAKMSDLLSELIAQAGRVPRKTQI